MNGLWTHVLRDRLPGCLGLAGFLALWQLAPALGIVDPAFIPPPSVVCRSVAGLVGTGEMFLHASASLKRVLAGFGLAVAAAVPLGFALGGGMPALGRFLGPLLTLLGQVNAFSLFPIFILFFGIGEIAKVAIIFWSSVWPILSMTIAGVRNVDPSLLKAARSMGASRWMIFRKVVLPAAAPSVFTGIRIGATVAFLMLIAAEMVGASTGLGWLIHNSQVNYIIPRVFAAAIAIALLGMGTNTLLRRLESRIVHRQPADGIRET